MTPEYEKLDKQIDAWVEEFKRSQEKIKQAALAKTGANEPAKDPK